MENNKSVRINREQAIDRISCVVRQLMEQCGLSAYAVATGCGIHYKTFLNIIKKEGLPRIDVLMAIADYFAIPLDFLCGRCGNKTANDILKNYPKYFMELRRASYEEYSIGRKKNISADGTNMKNIKSVYLPWPYNLLIAIDKKLAEKSVSQNEVDKLERALNMLRDKDRLYLVEYFKNGKPYEIIAKENNVTKQYVWTVTARGIRRLKYIYGIKDKENGKRKNPKQ